MKEENLVVHTYVNELIDNTDGRYDTLDSAWLNVPTDWVEEQIFRQGFNSLEEFLDSYTYDDTVDWIEQAIQDEVLLGTGVGQLD